MCVYMYIYIYIYTIRMYHIWLLEVALVEGVDLLGGRDQGLAHRHI